MSVKKKENHLKNQFVLLMHKILVAQLILLVHQILKILQMIHLGDMLFLFQSLQI